MGVTLIAFALALLSLTTPASSLDEFLSLAEQKHFDVLPFGERIAQIGLSFEGVPYVSGTLDQNPLQEECVVDWQGLDCVTFVELAWNLARLLDDSVQTQGHLTELVAETRYRGGRVNGYTSRLHYTSEWFLDNTQRGLLREITSELPQAAPDTREINFMTANASLYPAIRIGGEEVKSQIRAHEQTLTRHKRWYVPRGAVGAAVPRLNSGDFVGITTNRVGLDTSHIGMILVDDEGVRRFLHASSTQKTVVLDDSLEGYMARNPSATGIMVARPIAPSHF
ncbi:MAG: DUF1460 domain-containing protein [Fimbriimonadaceae bacterium]|nr:DUF1460 domain-containing protein [Fimbriimonadaceae bacterium]